MSNMAILASVTLFPSLIALFTVFMASKALTTHAASGLGSFVRFAKVESIRAVDGRR
jgi:hypothetical protein